MGGEAGSGVCSWDVFRDTYVCECEQTQGRVGAMGVCGFEFVCVCVTVRKEGGGMIPR